jgi:hypothetical protein
VHESCPQMTETRFMLRSQKRQVLTFGRAIVYHLRDDGLVLP